MATKICPHCGKRKHGRGFRMHEVACKAKAEKANAGKVNLEPLRKRYAKQIGNMTPKQSERFLRKAGGW